MGLPFFVWKNIDSRDMHVLVNEYPPFHKPKKRVTTINVPGRPSELIIMDDENDYESTINICECTAQPGADITALCGWLDGFSTVRFGNDPLYVRKARISDGFDLDKMLRGKPHRTFSIPFVSDPFKKLLYPTPSVTIMASGTNIHNPGTMASEPVIKINSSGGDVTLIVGTSTAIEIEGFSGSWTLIIDSEMKDCFNNSRSEFRNYMMDGDFPLLKPGDNNIAWTGNVSSVVITPNWRWLG